MDCDENSIRDDPLANSNMSQSDNRSCLSHSSYVEDIEPELRDLVTKNTFKTPRKKQRLSGYDQNLPNYFQRQDSDIPKHENVSTLALTLAFTDFTKH